MWIDPLTGKQYTAEIQGGGKVHITLRSGQSMILQTFNEPQELSLPSLEFHNLNESQTDTVKLEDNWKLSFIEEAPKVNETFNIGKLRTWETLDNESAKVTMGTGVYEISFDSPLRKDDARRVDPSKWAIDLGDVRESARESRPLLRQS